MRVFANIVLGWTPILAVATDGTRKVLEVVGWDGGSGTAPATGVYIGPLGFVSNIADGVDIAGGAGVSFSDGEVPAGLIDGLNGSFTIAHTPVTGSVHLFLNGQRLVYLVDYTITGVNISMTTIPGTGDSLISDYRY